MANVSTASASGPTVVGIGASAGGLAALRQLFEQIPTDSGLAFVVVVHLSPEHKSMLADLLQPSVHMPVQQVQETVPLEANNVYVIPPNCNLSAIDTHLRLEALEERRRERAPIDHFFRTLAATHDGHSIGVVLTGTGSDGTLGLREIKAKGGLILVQDPNEAEFDGMPQSAISTGVVDRVLTIQEIASALLRLASTGRSLNVEEMWDEQERPERALLPKVLAILRARTDRDFSRYKTATILRRTARRMQLNYIDDIARYVELLRNDPDEVRELADDLLINVTSFFRDAGVFHKLEHEIVPRLFREKTENDSVRVWSVGCATGEEAYSLAILMLEEAARRPDPPRIQIFASDLHKRSLEGAREGTYPGDIETDVSAERLQRFFRKESGGYRINKEVRDLVVFAPHNLLSDPPFSRLDLISCRNLLIYLERSVQREVVELFHYSLCAHGYMLLGSAETIDAAELFRTEDKKLCIFEKRNVPAPDPRLPVFPLTRLRLPSERMQRVEIVTLSKPYQAVHQTLLERFAPPSVLLGPDNKVVHLSESAGRYLVHPGGELTSSALRLVREELRVELQSLLQTARETKEAVDSAPIPVRFNGHSAPVLMHVRPALEADQDGFVLVIFEEHQATLQAAEVQLPASSDLAGISVTDQRVLDLEQQLAESRQQLQTIIEEYETTQEEMKAANEEMQSTNEELRSTLEELETSKEELQSINEELQTVNQENRHKVDELSQLSSDLQNLLAATDIATLFLDRDLRIMRYTPKLADIFNIRITDRGRPISDLTHRLGYGLMREDALAVLERLIPVEHEIEDDQHRWYMTRVLPYRSTEDRIEGVVITFMEITARKRAEDALREQESRFRALSTAGNQLVYRMSPDWKYMYQMDGNAVLANTLEPNESWPKTYLLAEDEPFIMATVQKAIDSKSVFELTHRVLRADGTVGWVLSRAVPMLTPEGDIREWFGSAVDITVRKEMEAALETSEERYRMLFESIDEGFCFVQVLFDQENRAYDYRFEEMNPAFTSQTGLPRARGRTARELLPNHEAFWFKTFGEVALTGEARRFEHEAGALNRWFDVYAFRVGAEEDHRLAVVFKDISGRKQAEERQALLIGELNHRVKNTLAAVQSIANQTLRNTPDPMQFAKTFQDRLQALARAHNLLTRRSWASAAVAEVVQEQVNVDDGENIEAVGPRALLSPQTAVALSLVLHELTTNARKYGALSSASGRLLIQWSVLEPASELQVEWIESDGPNVEAPSKRGFGTTLIERSLNGVGGSASIRFAQGGLICLIHVPLAKPEAEKRVN